MGEDEFFFLHQTFQKDAGGGRNTRKVDVMTSFFEYGMVIEAFDNKPDSFLFVFNVWVRFRIHF